MDYLDRYNVRVLKGATSKKDKIIDDLERSFEKYLKESPTCKELYFSQIDQFPYSMDKGRAPNTDLLSKELMSINDITNNDKKALDEKNLRVRKSSNIDVGCYVYFDENWWLVTFKECKIMNTYKKFIMRRCNQVLHYEYEGKMYDIPLSIKNLTLYSDGMADIKYTSIGDSKRMVAYGTNPITRTIDVGTRVMITNKNVFRFTNMNDFEHNGAIGKHGLIEGLVLQTALINNDDVDNNVAWNPKTGIDENIQLNKIKGEDKIYIGAKNNYQIDTPNAIEWVLDNDYIFCSIINQKNNLCVLESKPSSKYIGANVNLIARDIKTKDVIDIKTIKVRG